METITARQRGFNRIILIGRCKQLILLALIACLVSTNLISEEIRVSAAASLTESLKEIQKAYEKASSHKVILNLGASSMLARQIEEGAPADLFISADEKQMDRLDQKGLIKKETRKSFLSNEMVLITELSNPINLKSVVDLKNEGIKKIAIGEPSSVPVGVYAKEYLTKVNLWTALQPKFVYMENVRAVLVSVESGNVQAGFVYRTDARISPKVRVVSWIRENAPIISYPFAVTSSSKTPAAEEFLNFIRQPESLKVFEKYGFIVTK